MNDRHLERLRVEHLEWVFSPPGLPVPHRIDGQVPTTSILVRGAAGTGKTTLALALAVSLTDELDGTVYYLSTEIAPTDVRFKLAHVGLSRADLRAVSSGASTARIQTEHLSLVSEETFEEPGSRTAAALGHVEQVVLSGAIASLRVVVIDAFSLVGESRGNSGMRSRLASLIQAFDALGVSVILVEEAPVVDADWASFVVDLVFELSWGTDPDTGASFRRLAVPKSRFAPAMPGPHDYGTDLDKLAAWPELGGVDLTSFARWLGLSPRVAMLGPAMTQVTGLVGSDFVRGIGVAHAIDATPWLHDTAVVTMTGITRIGSFAVPFVEGPGAVVWAAIRHIREAGGRVVRVEDLQVALARSRFRYRLFADLQVLSSFGVLVVVHGSSGELESVPASFDFADGRRETARWGGWVPSLRSIEGGSFKFEEVVDQFWKAARESAEDVPLVRKWAIAHAYLANQEGALNWLLTQSPASSDELPYVRHALARFGRMKEARALLPDDASRPRLEGELYLSQFTKASLRKAEALYAPFLADPATPSETTTLMNAQLEQVRTALKA